MFKPSMLTLALTAAGAVAHSAYGADENQKNTLGKTVEVIEVGLGLLGSDAGTLLL